MTYSTPQTIAVYDAYPRKVGKPVALQKILRAILKDGFEFVLERTKAYADRARQTGRPMELIPYPATFFHQERYADDLDALLPISSARPGMSQPPAWQRVKTLEALLEQNRIALIRTVLPDPLHYAEPNGPRYARDLEAAKSKREQLKQTKSALQAKLTEAQKEICGA